LFPSNFRLKSIAEHEKKEMEKALKSCRISQQEPQKEPDTTKEVLPKTSSTKPEDKPSVSKTAPAATPALLPQVKPKASKPPAAKQVLPPLTAGKKSTTPTDAAANWMTSAKAEASAASPTTSGQVLIML
jgi:outer membrane biosynthesis protein TonB